MSGTDRGVLAEDDVLLEDAASSDPGLAIGSWRNPDSKRPVLVIVELQPQTDGTSNGEMAVDVDESGGTTADYSFNAVTPGELASGDVLPDTVKFYVPPGGSYQIRNVSDPNTANSVGAHREIVL